MLRTCACLGVGADLIEPAGFPTSDRHFRRAGMDYLEAVSLLRHASYRGLRGLARLDGGTGSRVRGGSSC